MTIEQNVKIICKQQGINMTTLAERLQVTPVAIYQIIKNPNVKLSTVERIASALNVNILDIINTENYRYINTNQTNTNNIMLTCPNCHKIIHVEIKPSTSAKANK